MADNHFESGSEGRVWDEYDWERFLQQQDRKTERYMELLEKYLDDPNRDQIIAKEMGWHHLLDENGKDWSANLDTLFEQRHGPADGPVKEDADDADEEDADGLDDDDLDEDEDEDEDFEEDDLDGEDEDEEEDEKSVGGHDRHPLYQAASALAVYIDQVFDEQDPVSQHPAVVRLTTSATLANVKLAAALSDDDVDELGMSIAYLKRALKAITNALEGMAQCEQERLVDAPLAQELRGRVFQVRDGIVSLMGLYRGEWRRRFGHGH